MTKKYKKRILLILICFGFIFPCIAQNYIGAGNSSGVTVYSSDNHQSSDWNETANAENTINGKGLDYKVYEASRFLSQATLGYTNDHVDDVINNGIENWIENQTSLATSYTYDLTNDFHNMANDSILAVEDSLPVGNFRPNWPFFSFAWWHQNTVNEDLLRHRVATALSQIFVISHNSNLSDHGLGLAHYYDMLLDHSFANYDDLLLKVALHPAMGYYLSHLNNPKTDSLLNIRPDENFAREIMQLFSIGLYELKMDGTFKLDNNGDLIPTYGQFEIKELAKVFTGLGVGAAAYTPYDSTLNLYFGKDIYSSDLSVPMMMYEWQHEQEAKTLVGGKTIPGGQPGMVDIEQAVAHISNHPNVPPFISKLLIQRLIKSNPSPAYVKRVAHVFADNGQGVRGDLKAVVKAILLDEEARNCEMLNDPYSSKLKEPLVRYTHFTRAVDKTAPNNVYWNTAYNFKAQTGQGIMASPTVFNFYLPTYAPNGDIKDAGLVAPEFQLHNSKSGIGYLNEMFTYTNDPAWSHLMSHWEQHIDNNYVVIDYNHFLELAKDSEAFINEMDRYFTAGQMTESTRDIIREIFDSVPPSPWWNYQEYRAEIALHLVMISPDYAIRR